MCSQILASPKLLFLSVACALQRQLARVQQILQRKATFNTLSITHSHFFLLLSILCQAALVLKNIPVNADIRDVGSIPGLGRSPGGRHSNPLQYFCLENPHGQRSLMGCSPQCRKESDTTEAIQHSTHSLPDCQFALKDFIHFSLYLNSFHQGCIH